MREMQQGLPFGEAEGTFAEREQRLLIALRVVEADLMLTTLMKLVFYGTAGGLQSYKKTYEELAERPHGLCCAKRSAQRTVEKAIGLGWLRSTPTAFASGGYAANEYEIDWPGLAESLDLRRRGKGKKRPLASGQIDQPYRQNVQGYSQIVHSLKDSSALSVLSVEEEGGRSVQGSGLEVQSWEEADEALRAVGVLAVRSTLDEAQERGIDAAGVVAIVEEFQRLPDLTAGAVVFRIREGAWPAPPTTVSVATAPDQGRDQAANRRARETAGAAMREQLDERRAVVDMERERLAGWELRYGADVDRLGVEQLCEALEAGGAAASVLGQLRIHGRDSPLARMVRPQVLEALATGAYVIGAR